MSDQEDYSFNRTFHTTSNNNTSNNGINSGIESGASSGSEPTAATGINTLKLPPIHKNASSPANNNHEGATSVIGLSHHKPSSRQSTSSSSSGLWRSNSSDIFLTALPGSTPSTGRRSVTTATTATTPTSITGTGTTPASPLLSRGHSSSSITSLSSCYRLAQNNNNEHVNSGGGGRSSNNSSRVSSPMTSFPPPPQSPTATNIATAAATTVDSLFLVGFEPQDNATLDDSDQSSLVNFNSSSSFGTVGGNGGGDNSSSIVMMRDRNVMNSDHDFVKLSNSSIASSSSASSTAATGSRNGKRGSNQKSNPSNGSFHYVGSRSGSANSSGTGGSGRNQRRKSTSSASSSRDPPTTNSSSSGSVPLAASSASSSRSSSPSVLSDPHFSWLPKTEDIAMMNDGNMSSGDMVNFMNLSGSSILLDDSISLSDYGDMDDSLTDITVDGDSFAAIHSSEFPLIEMNDDSEQDQSDLLEFEAMRSSIHSSMSGHHQSNEMVRDELENYLVGMKERRDEHGEMLINFDNYEQRLHDLVTKVQNLPEQLTREDVLFTSRDVANQLIRAARLSSSEAMRTIEPDESFELALEKIRKLDLILKEKIQEEERLSSSVIDIVTKDRADKIERERQRKNIRQQLRDRLNREEAIILNMRSRPSSAQMPDDDSNLVASNHRSRASSAGSTNSNNNNNNGTLREQRAVNFVDRNASLGPDARYYTLTDEEQARVAKVMTDTTFDVCFLLCSCSHTYICVSKFYV